jgi:hypothetical protein
MYPSPPSDDANDDDDNQYRFAASKLDVAPPRPLPSFRPPPTQRDFRHRVRSDRKLICDFRSVLHKPPATATATTTALPNAYGHPALLPGAGPNRRLLGTICASPPAEPHRACVEPEPPLFLFLFLCLRLEPLCFATPVLGSLRKASTRARRD